MWVSGALDQPKKIRKTAADIFANFGPDKLRKTIKKSKVSPGFPQSFPVDLAQNPLNPRTNGWASHQFCGFRITLVSELQTGPKRSARPPRIFSQDLGLKNREKTWKNLNCLRSFPNFSRGFSPNPAESMYKRLGPICGCLVNSPLK